MPGRRPTFLPAVHVSSASFTDNATMWIIFRLNGVRKEISLDYPRRRP
ncbi:hypothetical protein SATRM34S_02850 [Streptomyces atroolivaceus]